MTLVKARRESVVREYLGRYLAEIVMRCQVTQNASCSGVERSKKKIDFALTEFLLVHLALLSYLFNVKTLE